MCGSLPRWEDGGIGFAAGSSAKAMPPGGGVLFAASGGAPQAAGGLGDGELFQRVRQLRACRKA